MKKIILCWFCVFFFSSAYSLGITEQFPDFGGNSIVQSSATPLQRSVLLTSNAAHEKAALLELYDLITYSNKVPLLLQSDSFSVGNWDSLGAEIVDETEPVYVYSFSHGCLPLIVTSGATFEEIDLTNTALCSRQDLIIDMRQGGHISFNCGEEERSFAGRFFTIDGYTEVVEGTGDDAVTSWQIVDNTSGAILEKNGAGTLTLSGDNSWFNGTFLLNAGAVHFDSAAEIFGGQIIMSAGTSLIVGKASKESGHAPTITMGNGCSITYELGEGIHKFYGRLVSMSSISNVLLNLNAGVLKIEGDLSGYYGDIKVRSPSRLILKK